VKAGIIEACYYGSTCIQIAVEVALGLHLHLLRRLNTPILT
jgi:hypothetical protein